MFKNMKIGVRLGASFALTVLILVAVIGIGYVNLGRYADTSGWNVHTYKVLEKTGGMLQSLTNIETGQRGFLVAGKDEFLAPLNEGKTGFLKHLNDAKKLTEDNPKAQERLDKLKLSYEDWIKTAVDSSIAERRALGNNLQGYASIIAVIGGGKVGMDAMRAQIKEIEDGENALLETRGKEMTSMFSSTQETLEFGGLLGAILASLLAFWVTRSITRPLLESVAAADRLARGDLSVTIEADSNDEAGQLKVAMAALKTNIQSVLTDTNVLIQAAAVGNLEIRADASKHQGDFRKLVQGINDTVKNIAEPMQVTSNYVDQIARGIIPAQITTAYQGEYLVIRNNLNSLVKMMGDLLKETDVLIQGAAVGELNKRANAELFQGGWKQLVVGVNDTVKNIAEPMQVTANYVDQIARGIIPAQITTAYQGEYLVIRNNLNGLVKMMGDLLSETNILIQGAAVGELNKRANAEMFQGGWKQLVVGVNDTVKNIAEPMQVTANYVDQIAKGVIPAQITTAYQGEYLVIRNNLNGLVKMMGDLLSETGTLIQGAADGDLNKRANAAIFQGGWNELVVGVNQIIDGIVLPVNEAVAVLGEMEKGDLTQTVNGIYKGQLNDFKNTVNNTIAKLSQVIGEVNAAASNIASASEEVSTTAQSMSQATSEQAASVEETSASVEQMSASINQNTENAKVTDGMASQASKEAVEGGVAVKETVAAMKTIAGKIGIIDDIAYQTNLLALNAAIEAARAGEHGKGFAVVAAEVRKLAERSQVAAQEIGELAKGSVEKAESAGRLLDAIVPAIGKTSGLVQEIAAASSEQSSGVGQINTAMTQLNQITQQNASSSEELAATAEEMSSQAAQLQEVMGFFQVGSSRSHTAAPAGKPASAVKAKAAPVLGKTAAQKAEATEANFVRF
jgi:methyl-accepting chemotaxis protein